MLDRARALTHQTRIGIILGITIVVAIVALFVPPIPQDPNYHSFADLRALLGIQNFSDVVSNVPFFLVGALGIVFILRRPDDASGETDPLRGHFLFISLGWSWSPLARPIITTHPRTRPCSGTAYP